MKKKTLPNKKSKHSGANSKAKAQETPFERLSSAIADMKSGRFGRVWELVPDGTHGFRRKIVGSATNEAVTAREKLGLSQQKFAQLLGVSKRTLEGWEQGRRTPNKAAKVLLKIAASHPEAVLEAAAA
jgi:putative transcriptional regulator